ncbi:MAG: C40 family peptidase [Gammaproteobacteria bacterium]
MGKATLHYLLFSAALALLAACSSTPDYPQRTAASAPHHDTRTAHPGVHIAVSMLGKPYRYGGSSPHGFDCSGLVYYSYQRAGIHVPRTTYGQLNAANRVTLRELAAGDLLFFRLGRQPVSHVAIYTGNGQFIHAPSRGKRVSYGSMSDAYWKDRLVAAGRF